MGHEELLSGRKGHRYIAEAAVGAAQAATATPGLRRWREVAVAARAAPTGRPRQQSPRENEKQTPALCCIGSIRGWIH
ncbi:hypothetical protein AZ78_1911 [Lysobacter capsici AZ78]|uniref:Uncharacterized protein n=1 Tax=Lysobacter capsici AZ78 TaxID=1444315 RepID=A0A108U879_9GAMM|nr:hypothetical protein AZ78_1911 [Lysobacter capsici AZ78]